MLIIFHIGFQAQRFFDIGQSILKVALFYPGICPIEIGLRKNGVYPQGAAEINNGAGVTRSGE